MKHPESPGPTGVSFGGRRSAELTPREAEVFSYVRRGYTAKEIGRRLAISHRTVEVHRARIVEKLGARNIIEAVALLSMHQNYMAEK